MTYPKPTIQFKDTSRFIVFSPALAWIFHVLSQLVLINDDLPNIYVTSINDSVHMAGSKHYTDEAIDIRSHNFTSDQSKHDFIKLLLGALNTHPDMPNSFTVLFESAGQPNEHFHVQVAKGMNFNYA